MVQRRRQLEVAQGSAIRKRNATTFIEGRYWVWCNKERNELTYRQVSRVTDKPNEVKTCPTHYSMHNGGKAKRGEGKRLEKAEKS